MHLILVSMWFFTKKVNVFTKKNLQLRRRPVWALGHLRCKPFVGHWPWYQRCWSAWSLKVWCFFCCVFFSVSSCCLFLVDGAGKGEVVVFMLILFAFLEKVWCLLFVGSLQVPLWWWKPSIPIMSWHWERQDTSDFLCAVFLSEGRERSWFCSGSDEKSPHKWRDQRFLLEWFQWWYINGAIFWEETLDHLKLGWDPSEGF